MSVIGIKWSIASLNRNSKIRPLNIHTQKSQFVHYLSPQQCFISSSTDSSNSHTDNHKRMQSNVMLKKSWTTASITSALELEDDARTTPFQSRDLIREYLMKSLVKVPEILKSQQQLHCQLETSATSTREELNFAYKHPLVIAEELKLDAGESMAKLGTAAVDNSSIIVPQRKPKKSERPHLIGKVTPNIARTWEQLSSAMDCASSSVEYGGAVGGACSGSRNDLEEERQSYILFVRKPFNFEQRSTDGNEFAVNKIHHQVESEKFYDSIEEYGDDYEEEIDVDCMDDEEEEEEENEEEEEDAACGGEIMADQIDSLEIGRDVGGFYSDNDGDVIVWSIES